MDRIKVLALGGLDEDGKDLYVLEINDDIFVCCGGFKYPSKTTPGIDFIIADYSYLVENKNRVKAYIIPKSKNNCFGAIPYIYKEVKAPIYCTKLTKFFLESFSKLYLQENDYIFKVIELPASLEIANHHFDFYSTCASMPSTFGFALATDRGNIVYSGDFLVEYSSEEHFRLDLNTLGKIAEKPTLLLMAESVNALHDGYCSPNHRLYNRMVQTLHNASGRVFVAINNDNLYHVDELFRACKETGRKVYLYDETSRDLYNLGKNTDSYNKYTKILSKDEVLRTKDSEVVIMISDESERIYEKVSLLANNEQDDKLIKINTSDTFYLACIPSDNIEIVATSVIDELYRCGCNVVFETRNTLAKMHAYSEDLKMLLSLLKPKYYLPIEGYYVSLLANAKVAFEMGIGLSHSSIFLLDNGQSIIFEKDKERPDLSFNYDNKVLIGDVMIDGIGVGDVVNEIINDRNRLGEDGVVVLGLAVSKEERKILAGPDIQMRGFLFLKDKDADQMLKEITQIFIESVEDWLRKTTDFDVNNLENNISNILRKMLLKNNNRNPVVKPNIVII